MSFYKVSLDRVHDLEKVVEYRAGKECEDTGWRDNLIFLHCLYNCYAGCTVDHAIEKALELNNKLNIPLKERDITSKKTTLTNARTAYLNSSKGGRPQNKGVYRYSTSKIIEMIGLTEEEKLSIEFKTLVSEEERRKLYDAERYKRQLKEKGEKSKKDKMSDVRKEIKKLLDQELTQKRIAEKLGVSLSTVNVE